MNIVIRHPKIAHKSAKKLAEALGGIRCSSDVSALPNSFVINYGCSSPLVADVIINHPVAVANCVNKKATFALLASAGVPVPDWAEGYKNIPKDWELVVSRKKANDGRGKDIQYASKEDSPKDCELYTEYFEHQWEFRIVLLNGKIVGRYAKERDADDMWQFIIQDKGFFPHIDEACITAAEALGIDYVGFDVLAQANDVFVVLEANSAPILTPEAIKAFKKLVKGSV